jgi:hypothetical protein
VNFVDNDAWRAQLSGACTGLAYLDGSVIGFTESTVEVISGDGPDARGSGYFSAPRIISHTVGCSNYRSIVQTETGIFFQANHGYCLLPRGLGPVQYVGEAIRSYTQGGNASYCWSSALTTKNNDQLAVWLVSSDSSTAPSNLLVYDLIHNQWFWDDLDGGEYREIGDWSVGLALCTNSLDTDDVSTPICWQPYSGVTTDDGSTFIDAKLSTDTIHPHEVGGWGHVRAVMVVFDGSNFTLHIDVTTDEQTQQQASFDVPSNSNTTNYRVVMLEHPLCSTIQIDVYDSSYDSNNTLTFSPVAIVLDVDTEDKMRLLSEGERG